MNQPTVCAVMLTADRPEYARKAVECFQEQTYTAKRMYIFDSGETPDIDCLPQNFTEHSISYHRSASGGRRATASTDSTIGHLRNLANGWCACDGNSDILIHWDDDDWSHPNRIAEQVALLQSSGADCVGYREMLFWREGQIETIQGGVRKGATLSTPGATLSTPGEAWLYSNPNPAYCLGTSLCYWRRTWERKPFEAVSQGEDFRFTAGLNTWGSDGIFPGEVPRMIARIHPGNTSIAYKPELMRAIEKQGGEWKRVPRWDEYCRSVME